MRELDHLASSLDGVAGYIVTDLTTNTRVAARLERERDAYGYECLAIQVSRCIVKYRARPCIGELKAFPDTG